MHWTLVAAAWAAPDIDAPLRSGASATDDAAVVIAVADYAFLPDVDHALRDATAFYNLLLYTRGVPQERIQLLKGANVDQIRRAVASARDDLGPDGTLWVYFSGHGGTDPSGRPLLVGDDAKPEPTVFVERSIAVADLGLPAEAVVVADASFDGTGWDGQLLVPGARFAVPAYVATGAEPTLWTAGDGGARRYTTVDHGLFTWLVVGALRGWADGALDGEADGAVSLDEARAYVARGAKQLNAEGPAPALHAPRPLVLARGTLEPGPDLAALPDVNGRLRPVLVPAPGGNVIGIAAHVPVPPVRYDGGRFYVDARGQVFDADDLAGTLGDGKAFTQRYEQPVGVRVPLAFGLSGLVVGPMFAIPGAIVYSIDPENPKGSGMLTAGAITTVSGGVVTAIAAIAGSGRRRRAGEWYNDAVGSAP